MKPFRYMIIALALLLGGCAVGVQQQMEGPPAPPVEGFTATPAPSRVAVLATATPGDREVPAVEDTGESKNRLFPTLADPSGPPVGMVPPLDKEGWQEIALDGFPFTFQLPFGWAPVLGEADGWAWSPVGEPAAGGETVFRLKILRREPGQELTALLPGSSVMDGRAEVNVLGGKAALYRMTVTPEGAAPAYQSHVLLPDGAGGTVYLFSVSAPTPEGRESLEGILLHALDSLREKEA